MTDEPEKPREETPAPSCKVRLAWWFGIYLATGGFSAYWIIETSKPPPDPLEIAYFWIPLLAFFFPAGLACCYGSFSHWIFGIRSDAHDFLLVFAGFLAYATYGVHLALTWKAKTQRKFLLLMLSLALFVSTGYVVYVRNH